MTTAQEKRVLLEAESWFLRLKRENHLKSYEIQLFVAVADWLANAISEAPPELPTVRVESISDDLVASVPPSILALPAPPKLPDMTIPPPRHLTFPPDQRSLDTLRSPDRTSELLERLSLPELPEED